MIMRPYTRYMFRLYLWFVLVAFLALLSVVTTINVATEIREVWQRGQQAASSAPWLLTLEYLFLRILDNGSQIFTIALVLGVVWAEFAHQASGRHTMVRATGLSFFKGAKAAILIAALALPVQLVLDNWVRPHAFMTLSVKHLGEYGWAYERIRSGKTYWLPFGDDVIHARIKDDPEPKIQNVTVYRFSGEGELSLILQTNEITEDPDTDTWHAAQGSVWPVAEDESSNTGRRVVGRTISQNNPFDLGYAISDLWLKYRDIHPKYIPTADLLGLAASDAELPAQHPNYRSWIHIRIAQAVSASLLVLCLIAVFDLMGGRYGIMVAAGAMLIVGYFGFVLTRLTAVFAEHSASLSVVMTWMFPAMLALSAAVLLQMINRRDARALT